MLKDAARQLEPLFDVLRDRWGSIRPAWEAAVAASYPEAVAEAMAPLSRINVDAHEQALVSGDVETYLAAMRLDGGELARLRIPFHAVMHSLHLFEEHCGDELKPALRARPELWNDMSALDQVIHAGVAALAEGYFMQLHRDHQEQMLAHLRDVTATLSHEINNPLASIAGHAELLLALESLEPRVRERLERIQAGALRIDAAIRELLSATSFTKEPYLPSLQIISPAS